MRIIFAAPVGGAHVGGEWRPMVARANRPINETPQGPDRTIAAYHRFDVAQRALWSWLNSINSKELLDEEQKSYSTRHAGLDGLDELAQVALDPGEFRFVPRFLCILPCGEAVKVPLKLGDESYE
jgi:hypothetical protein